MEPVFTYYSHEIQETANENVKALSEPFLLALWSETYLEVGKSYPGMSSGPDQGGPPPAVRQTGEAAGSRESENPTGDPDFEDTGGEFPDDIDEDTQPGDLEELSAIHKRLIQRAHINLASVEGGFLADFETWMCEAGSPSVGTREICSPYM